MKKIYLFLFSIVVLFSSCANEETEIQNSKEDIFGFNSVEEARAHLGDYADIFNPTNGSMYIRSTLFGSSESEQGEIFGRYLEDSKRTPSNGGDYKFGNVQLSFDASTKSYLPQEGRISNDAKLSQIANLFGNQSEFSLSRDGSTLLSFDQYVPEKIVVDLKNAKEHDGSNLSVMKRDDFEISWNMDDQNTNGVIAYLWWNGNKAGMSAYEQKEEILVNRAIKLDDNGKAKLSSELFNDIPNNAIVTVFFIRGNVSIKEFDGKSFKFYSVTQNKHNLVIKD